MSRTSTLILLGILTVLTPFSGLPVAIRTFLAVIFGACVAGIGLAIRAGEAHAQKKSVEATLSPAAVEPTKFEEPVPPIGISPI